MSISFVIIILEIFLWCSVLGILHSYLIYPFILRVLAKDKSLSTQSTQNTNALPQVSVIMSLYNEEKVIEQKLESLLALDYPTSKLQLMIGSDCSADQTNAIVQKYAAQHSNIHFFPFKDRRGKPPVVNELCEKAIATHGKDANHIFLLTDANVILEKDTLQKMTRHFTDEAIVLVDANMKNTGMRAEGISKSEHQYVSSEVMLKHREGLAWGKMIGPFGGCYAIRSNYFKPVPPKFLVDDFYIAMRAFEQGGKAINDLEASCYEAVSHDIWEEYRRKSRISAGNFQNLSTFKHLLSPTKGSLAFAFFSHKVLRWLGPFFIIIILLNSGILAYLGNQFYQILFLLVTLVLIGIPLLDQLLKSGNINVPILRNITYFNLMNVALLHGFFNFLKGIKNNVWEPPKRN